MLDVKDLNIEFHDHLVPETVVHQVNFHMDAGEIVGLVGESGSGKSMTALAIAGLLSRHDMKKTGEILFEGIRSAALRTKLFKRASGKRYFRRFSRSR